MYNVNLYTPGILSPLWMDCIKYVWKKITYQVLETITSFCLSWLNLEIKDKTLQHLWGNWYKIGIAMDVSLNINV